VKPNGAPATAAAQASSPADVTFDSPTTQAAWGSRGGFNPSSHSAYVVMRRTDGRLIYTPASSDAEAQRVKTAAQWLHERMAPGTPFQVSLVRSVPKGALITVPADAALAKLQAAATQLDAGAPVFGYGFSRVPHPPQGFAPPYPLPPPAPFAGYPGHPYDIGDGVWDSGMSMGGFGGIPGAPVAVGPAGFGGFSGEEIQAAFGAMDDRLQMAGQVNFDAVARGE